MNAETEEFEREHPDEEEDDDTVLNPFVGISNSSRDKTDEFSSNYFFQHAIFDEV
jgi:hypothetical protein